MSKAIHYPKPNAHKDPRGWLIEAAAHEGFLLAGIGPADIGSVNRAGLAAFLDDAFEGDMGWLRDTAANANSRRRCGQTLKQRLFLG